MMLIQILSGYWKTDLKRRHQRINEDNGKAMGIGNGQYRKVSRFSSNEFWKNIGYLVLDPTFGLVGSRMWEKEEDIKISRKKRKRRSIRIKVDLYEILIIYYLLSLILFYDILINVFLPDLWYLPH